MKFVEFEGRFFDFDGVRQLYAEVCDMREEANVVYYSIIAAGGAGQKLFTLYDGNSKSMILVQQMLHAIAAKLNGDNSMYEMIKNLEAKHKAEESQCGL